MLRDALAAGMSNREEADECADAPLSTTRGAAGAAAPQPPPR